MWANNKVRHQPAYEANDVDMLGTQIKFDTTCWFLRPIRPAAFDLGFNRTFASKRVSTEMSTKTSQN